MAQRKRQEFYFLGEAEDYQGKNEDEKEKERKRESETLRWELGQY